MVDDPDRVMLRATTGGAGLSFRFEGAHVPPVWPGTPGDEQMQAHLDIGVDDLDAGVARAVGLGAALAAHQPQDDVRELLDPAGHPYCQPNAASRTRFTQWQSGFTCAMVCTHDGEFVMGR